MKTTPDHFLKKACISTWFLQGFAAETQQTVPARAMLGWGRSGSRRVWAQTTTGVQKKAKGN